MSEQHEDGRDESREEARREPVFNLPPVVLFLIGTCVLVYIIQDYVLTDQQYSLLLNNAAFIPIRYSGQFELGIAAFTSLFTYAFLHGSVTHLPGSITHLAINMIWLAAFGSPLANRLGTLRFLVFWAVTSLCAVILYYLFKRVEQSLQIDVMDAMQAPLVGASGAISGMMGAAARFGFRIDRRQGKAAFSGAPLPVTICLRSRTVVAFLAIWMLINLLTGLVSFTPGVDGQIAWEAHIGGFLAGFFGIDRFDRKERKDLPPLDPPDETDEPNTSN